MIKEGDKVNARVELNGVETVCIGHVQKILEDGRSAGVYVEELTKR